jgi:hypothetical protein
MIFSALFKSINKLNKNSLIKKEFITFFSTSREFVDIKYILSESKDIRNGTEYDDELLAAMIMEETYDEDIKVCIPEKNIYTKKCVELRTNLEKLEDSVSEKSNFYTF